MLVRDCMKSDLITTAAKSPLVDAFATLQKHSIRHLPVVEGDKLVGLLSDRNLRLAMLPGRGRSGHSYRFPKGATVAQVMIPDPITVTPYHPVEDAAILLHDYKLGCLPVVESDRLVGVITVVDILAIFIELLGLIQESSRIDIQLRAGQSLAQMLRDLRQHDVDILSISISKIEAGERVYHLRLQTEDAPGVTAELRKRGYQVLGTY
ncbi:MAG TPA: CBS and ACT domain-containing protein [Acidobacteriota bacterium]